MIKLKTRSEVVNEITMALTYAHRQTAETHVILHADNAREFILAEMRNVTNTMDPTLNKIVPYSLEDNGIENRFIISLMNGARAALHNGQMDDAYWPYAVQDVAEKQSLMIQYATKPISLHECTGQKTSITKLHHFGQIAHTPKLPHTKKLQPRVKGYDSS